MSLSEVIASPLQGLVDPASLTGWLDAPSVSEGISVLNGEWEWEWEFVSYAEMAARTRVIQRDLTSAGYAKSRVAIVTANPIAFICGLFAVLSSGGTCVPLAPRLPFRDPIEHLRKLQASIQMCAPDVAIGMDEKDELPHVPLLSIASAVTDQGRTNEPTEEPHLSKSDLPALIQFSSGTSGEPKGIQISRTALSANVNTIKTWLNMGPDDATASWLPLYHDMGLIGTTITPIAVQNSLWLMDPVQFLRRPEVWLNCFDSCGATMTASPGFGYAHAARKVRGQSRKLTLDLSQWRVAIIGAEPIRRRVLEGFIEAFADCGFKPSAFCPAYGLSEATLIAAANPVDSDPLKSLTGRTGEDNAGLVSSGRAVPGTQIRVVDEAGQDCQDGELGEIWFTGSSIADGYLTESSQSFNTRWLRTGDMARMCRGELFVHGRISDGLKVRGKLVLAEDAEYLIQEALGIDQPLVVVPSRKTGSGITLLIESGRECDSALRKDILHTVKTLFDGATVDLVFVRRGGIPRTTSGKPKRRACWQKFLVNSEA